MYNKFKDILTKNKGLIKDNIILFFSFMILNAMSYFFHFYAGRKLGPSDYGIFGSLLSVLYIIAMPLVAVQTVTSKFVTDYKVKKDDGKLAYFLSKSYKKLTLYGLILVVVFIILSPFITSFLRIKDSTPFIILSLLVFLTLLLQLGRGALQGLQRFKEFGLNLVSEGITKLGVGILLISIGMRVNGAAIAFVLSFLVPVLLAIYFLKEFFKKEKKEFDTKDVYRYAYPMFIMLLSLTAFYTVDVILIKHFFESVDAGLYAALALLGKVVFFASMSVSTVMFPKVTELNALNKGSKGMLYKSLIFVLIIGGGITGFYFLFPRFSVNLLFGNEYLGISSLLGWFGVFMTLFSFVYIISLYAISIERKGFIWLLILFNILEIIAVYLYHISLLQIVLMLTGIMFILFLVLLVYIMYLNDGRTINNNSSV
jgi:O-antigen/teichoic acid export membrane protein